MCLPDSSPFIVQIPYLNISSISSPTSCSSTSSSKSSLLILVLSVSLSIILANNSLNFNEISSCSLLISSIHSSSDRFAVNGGEIGERILWSCSDIAIHVFFVILLVINK